MNEAPEKQRYHSSNNEDVSSRARLEEIRDRKERIERMYERFEGEYEDLNIQRLSVKEIRVVTGVLYCSIALSLAAVITMSVLLYHFLSVDGYEIDEINGELIIDAIKNNKTDKDSYQVGLSLKIIEGIMRSLSSILSCFLFFTFPQRVIGDSLEKHQLPHVEQGLLMLIVFVMMINPAYNPLSASIYWVDFANDIAFARNSSFLLSIATLSLKDFDVTVNATIVRISCILSVCATFLYTGVVSYAYGHTEKLVRRQYGYIDDELTDRKGMGDNDDVHDNPSNITVTNGLGKSTLGNLEWQSHPLSQSSDNDRHSNATRATNITREMIGEENGNERENEDSASTGEINNDIKNEIEIEKNPESLDLANAFYMRSKAFAIGIKGWVICRIKCKGKCGGFFSQLIEITPVKYTCAVIFYMLLSFILSFAFDFTPSQVPFVSFITIMRVCFSGPSGNFDKAFSYIFLSPDDGVPTEGSWCTSGYLPFSRAISGIILGICEVILLVMAISLINESRRSIAKMPYAKTRGKQLGFIFFQTSTLVLFSFSVLNGVILVSVPPIGYWIVIGMNATVNLTDNNLLAVGLVVDPLYHIGVNLNSLGFGCYQLVVSVWLLVLAFAYLPSTSRGWFGWFCAGDNPCSKEDDTEINVHLGTQPLSTTNKTPADIFLASQVKRRRVDNSCLPEEAPLYLVSEKDVSTLADAMFPNGIDFAVGNNGDKDRKMKKEYPVSKKLTRLLSRRGFSMASLYGSFTNGSIQSIKKLKGNPDLINQMKSNIFVLETEIILYHFMHMTYELGCYEGKSNLTVAEKQALIDDPKYKLIAHLENSLTDTHCLVAASDDRIIVAFRGTVSVENMKTDWDSTLIVSEAASKINPPTSSDDSLHAMNKLSKPPLIHHGFMFAYESIKDALYYCIESLLEENPSRVIFTTGHSLGGGLAVVCALDLQVSFNPVAMGCTTWGCPKVGNYSFATRFNYAISCCRRFVCATDIITKIPFDPPFKDTTLNGWWHVGTEILLDVDGNMIIRPSTIESFLIHGWRRFSTHNHPRSAYACCLVVWCLKSGDSSFQPHWWKIVLENVNKFGVPKRLRTVPTAHKNDLLDMLARSGIVYSRGRFKYRNYGLQTEDNDEDSSFRASENNKYNAIALGNEEDDVSEKMTRLQDIFKQMKETLMIEDENMKRFEYKKIRKFGEELIRLSDMLERAEEENGLMDENIEQDLV